MIIGTSPVGQIALNLEMANRHGLIAGATGTGKTVSLQVLAEHFSKAGVPVFTADIKGDLSGLAQPGTEHPKITERIEKIGLDQFGFKAYPTVFWDLFGKLGHPIRTTVSEMGPLLLDQLLDLNELQEGILHSCFSIADQEGLLLLDSKDLWAMVHWVGENSEKLEADYGKISTSSIGAIQRRLKALENFGADIFFGEPALQLQDLMRTDFSGNGVISVLDATALMSQPRVYSSFLLWLMAELFEDLEEVGDQEKPRLVFFFDEAHLLFKHAPKPLIERIETVVRLIRSKGVGIYFVTQHPGDIPDSILGQLGNRIQHALRAFTPKDRTALRAAAQTMRTNPDLDTEAVIAELSVGEALVSFLDESGSPTIVQRTLICPPESRMGPITPAERAAKLASSPLKGRYDEAVDRESAYEILKKRRGEKVEAEKEEEATKEKKPAGRQRQSATEAFFKSMLRSIGRTIGNRVVRGVLGSVLKK